MLRGRRRVTMKATDLAYLAGLIDGEGSIMVVRTRSGYTYGAIAIYNSNKEALCWVQRRFGGGLYLNRKAGVRSKISFKKDIWVLVFGVKLTRVICQKLLPFLKIKLNKAKEVIALPVPIMSEVARLQSWKTRRRIYGKSGRSI